MPRLRLLAPGACCVTLCAILVPAATRAIVIRHDRPDASYVQLARDFKAYGDVVGAGSTLIAPRWLLTAGHVAREIGPYNAVATVNGRQVAIDRVIFHPEYVKAGLRGRSDLALLRLAEPVRDVEPIPLYRAKDEAGQVVTFIGRGRTGTGETGPTGEDGKLRGATNRLERADETSVYFEFDSPETATDLEGISGPGDSGGPALLKVKGKLAVAGVSSANIGNGKGLCRYGTTEVYARVSTALEWIEETMRMAPESTLAWTFSPASEPWPKTRAGEIAPALLAAYNSGDAAVMEAFSQKFRDPQALARATPEVRAQRYLDLFRRVGKVTAVERAAGPGDRMLVLLRDEKGGHHQLSLMFLDPANTRFDGFWIGEATPRR
jgi:hypothetical protein